SSSARATAVVTEIAIRPIAAIDTTVRRSPPTSVPFRRTFWAHQGASLPTPYPPTGGQDSESLERGGPPLVAELNCRPVSTATALCQYSVRGAAACGRYAADGKSSRGAPW